VDASRFQNAFDEFQLHDLVAKFEFKSATSISFALGRYSDTLKLPDSNFAMKVGPRGVFTRVGRVDVHHPCEGHIKAQLNVVLPTEYHEFERMQGLVKSVFEALGIQPDETFETLFVTPEKQTEYENATDREGMTDRMYA
jgi:hypothetical protein